jgi:hypothetical protein
LAAQRAVKITVQHLARLAIQDTVTMLQQVHVRSFVTVNNIMFGMGIVVGLAMLLVAVAMAHPLINVSSAFLDLVIYVKLMGLVLLAVT